MKYFSSFHYKVLLVLLIPLFNNCSSNQAEQKPIEQLDTTEKEPPIPDFYKAIIGISQDSLSSYLKLAKEIKTNKKTRSPFKNLRYNKVIAYEYQGAIGERVISIVDSSKLAATIKKQQELNQEQVNNLTTILGSDSTYGEGYASCFRPGFGVVFFNDSTIVYHASICLDCNRLTSSLKIPAMSAKSISIGDDYKYPAEGFSKKGGQKLGDLFKELKLGEFMK